jgi:acyl dehydratase
MSDGCPYWEDFNIGDVFEFEGPPLTKKEIFEFASNYDPQPIHLDEEMAKNSILGGLSASGWHSCARLMRLICDTYLCETEHIASPGVEEVRWISPVRPGDRFMVKRTVKNVRSVPGQSDRGLVQAFFEVHAQDGRALMTMDCLALYKRRTPAKLGS